MDKELLIREIIARGFDATTAARVARWIHDAQEHGQNSAAWKHIYEELLPSLQDFSLHAWLYEQCYRDGFSSPSDRAAWLPPNEVIDHANVTIVAQSLGLPDYRALHRWSVDNPQAYWEHVVERLGICFRRPCNKILDASCPTSPRWFIGASMNIVDSCFQCGNSSVAIIESNGEATRKWSLGELRQLVARIADGLLSLGVEPGEAIGMVMPMTAISVAIYLAIVAVGAVVVSIADSFSEPEIATRLRIADASRVFTQDCVRRENKVLFLYEKFAAIELPTIVVSTNNLRSVCLRAGDICFDDLLGKNEQLSPVPREPQDFINILFSSGTTGDPKAIPWDHTAPIKCAADAHFHQDVHPGEVICWPTSLGWMMGPWVVFAALLNRATIALYTQTPNDAGFGRFVQDAGVTMLGVIPSLVRTWRQTECMRGVDWSRIRTFSSTGECSNPTDMLYLMHLAGYRPVVEYCGGTELAGGYVTGTVVQPSAPSTFTTPALGLDFVVLSEDRQPAQKGEAFIKGPSIGLSTRLINRDHDAIYFRDTATHVDGTPLRRHGDELESIGNGYFRVAGRADDTMNLGGIKVGCAEIERILNQLTGIVETAAVASAPDDGGPSQLVIFVVPCAGNTLSAAEFKADAQQAIRTYLNPLFHVAEVYLLKSLPRTASNKIVRRELRRMHRQRLAPD